MRKGVIEGQKKEWKRKRKKRKRGLGGRDEATRNKMRQRWFCLFGVRGTQSGDSAKAASFILYLSGPPRLWLRLKTDHLRSVCLSDRERQDNVQPETGSHSAGRHRTRQSDTGRGFRGWRGGLRRLHPTAGL